MLKAPTSLIREIDEKYIGIKYIDAEPGNPEIDPAKGFDCWGWCWFYNKLAGRNLPLDVYEAKKLYEDNTGRRQFLDIVSIKQDHTPVPHLGVMENEFTMIHCSRTSGGVARMSVLHPAYRAKMTFYRLKVECIPWTIANTIAPSDPRFLAMDRRISSPLCMGSKVDLENLYDLGVGPIDQAVSPKAK